jgi:hypothetical protein
VHGKIAWRQRSLDQRASMGERRQLGEKQAQQPYPGSDASPRTPHSNSITSDRPLGLGPGAVESLPATARRPGVAQIVRNARQGRKCASPRLLADEPHGLKRACPGHARQLPPCPQQDSCCGREQEHGKHNGHH